MKLHHHQSTIDNPDICWCEECDSSRLEDEDLVYTDSAYYKVRDLKQLHYYLTLQRVRSQRISGSH